MRTPQHKRTMFAAAALVTMVYGLVLVSNPDLPVVQDESWQSALDVLTFPGLLIVSLLVWLRLLGVHADFYLFMWLISFVAYFGMVYWLLRLPAYVAGRFRRFRARS